MIADPNIAARLRRLLTTAIPPPFHSRGPADLRCLCDGCVEDDLDDRAGRLIGIPTLRAYMRSVPR
jgi:hypothetical protein